MTVHHVDTALSTLVPETRVSPETLSSLKEMKRPRKGWTGTREGERVFCGHLLLENVGIKKLESSFPAGFLSESLLY